MRIHLIGGFLGSGKTTAIATASGILLGKNTKVGVITNDQGRYLVDSRFMRFSEINTAEVVGSCFCCNYEEFTRQIDSLKMIHGVSEVFAESVGSCTDLVATILKPLRKYKARDLDQLTLTCVVDSRLLLSYLMGMSLPFSSETNYIWEKQLEESGILIVNKVDLLKKTILKALKKLVEKRYQGKSVLYQNSTEPASVLNWIDALRQYHGGKYKSIDIDYKIYAQGEANLAWLDEELEICTADIPATEITIELVNKFVKAVKGKKWPVGHIKFFIDFGTISRKLSFTDLEDDFNTDWKEDLIQNKTCLARLLVNARIQCNPDHLRNLFKGVLTDINTSEQVTIKEKSVQSFSPGYPAPTYRMF